MDTLVLVHPHGLTFAPTTDQFPRLRSSHMWYHHLPGGPPSTAKHEGSTTDMSTKRFSFPTGTAFAEKDAASFWADSTSVWRGQAKSLDGTVSIPFAVESTSTKVGGANGWFLLVEGTGGWYPTMTSAVRDVIRLAQARAVTATVAAEPTVTVDGNGVTTYHGLDEDEVIDAPMLREDRPSTATVAVPTWADHVEQSLRQQDVESHPLYPVLALIDPVLWAREQADSASDETAAETLRAARSEVERILIAHADAQAAKRAEVREANERDSRARAQRRSDLRLAVTALRAAR